MLNDDEQDVIFLDGNSDFIFCYVKKSKLKFNGNGLYEKIK